MKLLDTLIELIETAINIDADNSLTWGNIIADSYNDTIDTYRSILKKWHNWVSDYKQELIEKTGIKNLKIKYTNNNWYFIEIPKNQIQNIPDNFIHKQTLVSAHRYSTSELQKFQSDLDLASSELYSLEYECFIEIRNIVKSHFSDLYHISRKIEKLDFYSNAAYISQKYSYTTPEISCKNSLKILWGKHPVMKQVVSDFISNDLILDKKEYIHVITWPNMWWKSTFLRQNALLILMSHIWFDIPVSSAVIPITDRIFSRVWSWDNLFLWQSTFMVEMQEIAYILRNATDKSFIIIDEIWRGTSTYDGMSLAWSILKYNHDEIKAKTLFATHYHEIIDFSQKLDGCWNYSVAVWENDHNIVFLRKIIPWGIKKSYGIEVARLAGIPKSVLEIANITMQDLRSLWNSQQLSLRQLDSSFVSENWKNEKYELILRDISNVDVNNITPIQAISYLQKFQEQVKKMK